MATFRFRLASVLRYRSRIREEKQGELQKLERAKDYVVAEIQKQEQRVLQQIQALEGQQGKIVSALAVRLQGDFSQHVSQRIHDQHRLLTTVQLRLEEKRQEVAQADRDVKSLEQLRTRLWERHYRQVAQEEQQDLDEVGQRKFHSKKDRNR